MKPRIGCRSFRLLTVAMLTEMLTLAAGPSAFARTDYAVPVQWTAASGGNGHWYSVSLSASTWPQARLRCEAAGGELACTETAAECEFLRNAGLTTEPFVFVGLFQDLASPSYAEPGGGWTWVSGEPFDATLWQPGEPNNYFGDERYGELEGPGRPPYLNDVIPDGEIRHYIEWSADCNEDGIVDFGQIRDGSLVDADADGVPDICELQEFDSYEDAVFASQPFAYWRMQVSGAVIPGAVPGSPAAAVEGGTQAVETPVGCIGDVGRRCQSGGLNAGVDSRYDLDSLGSFSFEFWVRDLGTGQRFVASQGRDITPGSWAVLFTASDDLVFRRNNTGPSVVAPFGSLVEDAWNHVVCTLNNELLFMTIHINGLEVASLPIVAPLGGSSSDPLLLGRHNFAAPYNWPLQGDLDEVAIYDRPLTQAEIQSHFLSASPEQPCVPTLLVPGEFPTIQAAIDSMPADEAAIVAVSAGTYNESFSLDGKDIVVRGAKGGATVLDGTGLPGSIARFAGGEPTTAGVESLVFRNGTTGSKLLPKHDFTVGGAIFGRDSDAFVRDCRFEDNRADFGGAVYLFGCGLDVEDCVFSGNEADVDAGGLFAFRCAGAVVGCEFLSNASGLFSTGSGSAFKAVGGRVAGDTVALVGCTITGNSTNVEGAAVEQFEDTNGVPGVLRIEGCSITGNSSGGATPFGAGGLRVIGRQSSCVLADGTEICANLARNVDGAYLVDGAATVCDCESDIGGNGQVDAADLGILLGAWGAAGGDGAGDLDHDGFVNAADLSILLSNWGPCGG